jgi:quercetin dioxygenase-like cupin family protein
MFAPAYMGRKRRAKPLQSPLSCGFRRAKFLTHRGKALEEIRFRPTYAGANVGHPSDFLRPYLQSCAPRGRHPRSAATRMGGTMKILTSELHTSRRGPEAYFTGTVWLNEIVGATPPSHLKAIRVWFAPGSRTAWHTHPVGQTLHVLDGLGLVQTAGKAPQIIRPGDTVSIAPQERHWHGAAPGRTMTHLALQETDEHGSDVVWLEHVSDDEYSQPPI